MIPVPSSDTSTMGTPPSLISNLFWGRKRHTTLMLLPDIFFFFGCYGYEKLNVYFWVGYYGNCIKVFFWFCDFIYGFLVYKFIRFVGEDEIKEREKSEKKIKAKRNEKTKEKKKNKKKRLQHTYTHRYTHIVYTQKKSLSFVGI